MRSFRQDQNVKQVLLTLTIYRSDKGFFFFAADKQFVNRYYLSVGVQEGG